MLPNEQIKKHLEGMFEDGLLTITDIVGGLQINLDPSLGGLSELAEVISELSQIIYDWFTDDDETVLICEYLPEEEVYQVRFGDQRVK